MYKNASDYTTYNMASFESKFENILRQDDGKGFFDKTILCLARGNRLYIGNFTTYNGDNYLRIVDPDFNKNGTIQYDSMTVQHLLLDKGDIIYLPKSKMTSKAYIKLKNMVSGRPRSIVIDAYYEDKNGRYPPQRYSDYLSYIAKLANKRSNQNPAVTNRNNLYENMDDYVFNEDGR